MGGNANTPLYGDPIARVPIGIGGGGGDDAGTPNLPPGCGNITGDRKTQVCLRWKCDRMILDEGSYDGDVPACMPGVPWSRRGTSGAWGAVDPCQSTQLSLRGEFGWRPLLS